MQTNQPAEAQFARQLDGIALFEGLDERSRLELARRSRWRTYEAGEVVALEGEVHPGLYYLQYGFVKVVKVSPSGREQILRFLEPGETFNEVGVFANQTNPATAIALEDAGIWLISREALLQLLELQPAFAHQVIVNMAERMLYLVSLVTDLSLRPVTGRLARLLLDEANGDVLDRPKWYTQAELSARLGTVPDVVQRALRSLENDGLILAERRRIIILDRPALAELAL